RQTRHTLESLGLSIQGAHPIAGASSWRFQTDGTSMSQMLALAERLCHVTGAAMSLVASLGKPGEPGSAGGDSLPFLPAASVRRGMLLFDGEGGYDPVEQVETIALHAPVYDLDIEQTHNFIANGIVTHNSIYSWRGANPKVLLQFEQDFPQTQVVLLEQNYRSTQVILDAAHGVVRQNQLRKDKKLWTDQIGGDKITVHEAYNEEEEAAYVVNEVRRLTARGLCRLRDCAVMYRTNAQSRALEEQF